jgi:hypothetical protein
MGHCLGCAGKFTSPFLTPRFHVTARRIIEIAGCVEIEPRVDIRSIRVCGADALVGSVEISARPFINVFRPELVGRSGQVRVQAVQSSRVTGMVDSSGQVVCCGAELASAPQVALFPRPNSPPVEACRPLGPVANPLFSSSWT